MTADELIDRATEAFGERWTTLLAKVVNVTPRTMRNYKSGTRVVPPDIADKVRELSALGIPAIIIKRATLRAFPECPPHRAHLIARYAEDDLTFYKLLRDSDEAAREPKPVEIRGRTLKS